MAQANRAPADTPLVNTNLGQPGVLLNSIQLAEETYNNFNNGNMAHVRAGIRLRFWADIVPTVSIIDPDNLVLISVGFQVQYFPVVGCTPQRECGWLDNTNNTFRILDQTLLPMPVRTLNGTPVGAPVTGWVNLGLPHGQNRFAETFQIPRNAYYLERHQYTHARSQRCWGCRIDDGNTGWYADTGVTRYQIGLNINRWACQQPWNREDPGGRCVNYCVNSQQDCQRSILPIICPVTNPDILSTPICRNISNTDKFFEYFLGLISSYCTPANMRDPFCITNCTRDIYTNACRNSVENFCAGPELERPDSPCLLNYCFNNGRTDTCNNALTNFCKTVKEDGTYTQANNPICYCFMPYEYYLNDTNRFVHSITNISETAMNNIRDFLLISFNNGNYRPFCNDPRCSGNNSRIPWPQAQEVCPDNTFCLNYINFDIIARSVTINGGININQKADCTNTRNHVQGLIEQDDATRAEQERLARLKEEQLKEEARIDYLADIARLSAELDTAEAAVVAARAVLASKTPGTPEHAAAQAALDVAIANYNTIQDLIHYDEEQLNPPPDLGIAATERAMNTTTNSSNTWLYVGIGIAVVVIAVIIGIIIWVVRRRKAKMAMEQMPQVPPQVPQAFPQVSPQDFQTLAQPQAFQMTQMPVPQ